MERDYDVAIVGAGAAGLAAAVSAADAGARVLVLEALGRVGGSSRLSGGHFFAAGTSVQREFGVDDSADAMFDHYLTLNQWLVDPGVVRRYCDLSAPTVEWALGLGIEFSTVYVSGVGTVPRGHIPVGEGHQVIQVLDRERERRGVDVSLMTRVDCLLTDDTGAVAGVSVGGDEVRCGAVVIASGGFGANPELLAKHFPQAAKAGDWSWYIGAEGARGDGLALGQQVGATLEGHDRGLLLLTPGFSRDLEVLLPGWLVLVGRDGRRFADETAPYTMMAGLVERRGGSAFAIFDEAARAAAAPTPFQKAYWVDEVLQRQADAGAIVRAATLAELAEAAGIEPVALGGTVARYNRDCTRGSDSEFLKSAASGMRPVAFGRGDVEARDAGMGVGASEHLQVQHAGQHHVAGVLEPAGDLARRVDAPHVAPDVGAVAPVRRSRAAGGSAPLATSRASSTASKIFW